MSRRLSVMVDEQRCVQLSMPIAQARLLYEQLGDLPAHMLGDKHMLRGVYKQLGAVMLISQPAEYFQERG